MKITIDLRSLSSGTISGVENYCLNLTENLLQLDKQNEYTLFYNSFGNMQLPDFHYVNSRIRQTKIPSKILNPALKFGFKKLEDYAGKSDWLLMPNLNQFNVSPDTKLAITIHDLSPVVSPEFYDIKRRIWHKLLSYKKALTRADVIFAVSEYTKNDIIRIFNISPEKIKVIYPGIDAKAFNPQIAVSELRMVRNLYNLPGEFILFLNTIEPRKNLAGLIKAFEAMDSRAHLVVCGRLGWKYGSDFNLIKKSKKSAKIKYIGYIEEKYKPALIKLAKVLVYPSFYEGFGFQPLEAMAMGTPTIASQVTSLPEIVGDSGVLVNPYDIGSLSLALKTVLDNEQFREQIISKGLEHVKKFNWQNSARQVLGSLQ